MKLKKVMAVTLAGAMGASMILAGCGGSGETATTKSETKAETESKAAETTEEAAKETAGETTAETTGETKEAGTNADLPTITFTHGYYQSESEWAAAAEMRAIYQEFADAHKNEYNFVIKADESGQKGFTIPL